LQSKVLNLTLLTTLSPKPVANQPRFSLMKVKNRFFCLLLVSILTACGGGGSSSGGGQMPPEDGVQRVIAIGDSIGNGFGVAQPWPPRLAGLIGLQVDNTSITNEQTSFGVANIQSLITQSNPSHVFILLGTNDAIRGSVPAAISNLQEMVDIARRNDVIPVVGTLPPIPRSSSEDRRAAEISRGIRGLRGARIAPVRGMLGNGSGLFEDGLHPTNRGQQLIAEAFAAQF